MSHKQTTAGVTLMELMVTMAIVAILAAVAYPSYQRYIARTNRSAAAACMSQYVQLLERAYSTSMTYPTTFTQPGCRSENNLNRRYTIAATVPTGGATYSVTATPTSLQRSSETPQCGTLTITDNGTRTVEGTGVDPNSCF